MEDGEEVASWEGDTLPFARLTTIAGVDISFDKAHPDHACAMLTVLTYPQLKVLHTLYDNLREYIYHVHTAVGN